MAIAEAALHGCFKVCSENMLQIYRRTPMPKYNFNKVASNFKFAAYFENTFL